MVRKAAPVVNTVHRPAFDQPSKCDSLPQGWFSLIFGIVFTLLLALSEAFDIDVLLGILMMPFITVMK